MCVFIYFAIRVTTLARRTTAILDTSPNIVRVIYQLVSMNGGA